VAVVFKSRVIAASNRLEKLVGGERVYLLLLAALVGVLGGFGAALFRELIWLFKGLSFPGGASLEALSEAPWYAICLPPAIGGLIVGPLVYFLAREAKGHGIPEVMNAVANRGGRIRRRVMAIKTLASAITIATGGSAGREGPIVQIGAGLGSSVGQFLGFEGNRLIILLGCGAAAGMAATFNAPIAGVILAVEVIIGSAAISVFSPIVVASVMGTIVARLWYGNEPAFVDVPEYHLASPYEIGLYVLLGLLAGVAATVFIRGIVLIEDMFEKITLPGWFTPVIGGAVVGAVALVFPQVLGVGYETIDFALHGGASGVFPPGFLGVMATLAILIVVKVFCTGMTLGSGGSGGVFAPAMVVGACLGCAFGLGAERFFPGQTGGAGAYALVGMGAVLAGATHAPVTAIIMLFEMTSNYTIILPLMLACIISVVVSNALYPTSIFTTRLVRRKVRLRGSFESELMRNSQVRALLRPVAETVTQATPLQEILRRSLSGSLVQQYVVDGKNRPVGVITLQRIKELLAEGDIDDNLVIAADIMRPSVTTVKLDDTLEILMSHMARIDTEEMPVVNAEGVIVGTVTAHDVMVFFEHEILRKQGLGVNFALEGRPESSAFVEVPEDQTVETVSVTGFVVGRTLRQLDLRATAGLNVVGIRRRTSKGYERLSPDPGRPLEKSDLLIVVGEQRAVDAFNEAMEGLRE
jgi:chloride channel protein, CIC family